MNPQEITKAALERVNANREEQAVREAEQIIEHIAGYQKNIREDEEKIAELKKKLASLTVNQIEEV